jgi:hypothetical protein
LSSSRELPVPFPEKFALYHRLETAAMVVVSPKLVMVAEFAEWASLPSPSTKDKGTKSKAT